MCVAAQARVLFLQTDVDDGDVAGEHEPECS